MRKTIKNALLMMLVMTVLAGLFYPLAVTGLARVVCPRQADGVTVEKENRILGYELIGQEFNQPQYFHGRPSAAGKGYDALSSSGTNLGPTSKVLKQRVDRAAKEVRRKNGLSPQAGIPADLVTASGSGLDPHISPESAYLQVKRVAKARNLPESTVRDLVDKYTEDRQLGILGEPRVNVLRLNTGLDSIIK